MRRPLHRHVLAGHHPLADLLQGPSPCDRIEPVDEQDPVEVVGLVGKAPSQALGPLDAQRLTVLVEPLGDDATWSCQLVLEPRQRQASLGVLDGLG